MSERMKWPDMLKLAHVELPEGDSPAGRWRIKRVNVTAHDEEWGRLRALCGGGGRFVPAGQYTNLIRIPQRDPKPHESWWTIVMSDTPDEIRDHWPLLLEAKGDVLIHGLGLGVCIGPLMVKEGVERVTVVEIDPDLIALVAPHYRERYPDRLEIIQGDALTWEPPKGKRWGAVWHDIWDAINADNLETMKRLHRRFGRRCDWQGSWARDYCEDAR